MDLPEIDTRWDFGDPLGSERAFQDLLAGAHASGNTALRAEVLTQIARAQGLQGRLADARATLDEAATLIPYAGLRARIRHLIELGRVLNSTGDPAGAGPLFREAWALARDAGEDALAIDAAHMLGIMASPAEQVSWTRRALDLAESSSHPGARRWRGPLLNNLGWSYHDQGQYSDALTIFERALDWRIESGDRTGELFARYAIGRVLRSLGRSDEAVTTQLGIVDDPGAADGPAGYAAEELAELFLALDHPGDAAVYAARAVADLGGDPWMSAHEPERLARLQQIVTGAPDGLDTTPP